MTVSTPKPEYPRPDRDRSERWQSLNGQWLLDTGLAKRAITVPYAWETIASGVRQTWLEQATYRREVTVPAAWQHCRVFLCFGAVHHQATVLIGQELVGTHTGGYTSFEFDITDHVVPGTPFPLNVEVWAPADKRAIPHGKQRSLPRDDYDGVSFTPSSGIWQSVWLEARGRTWADTVEVRGDSCTGFDLAIQLQGDQPAGRTVTVRLENDAATAIQLETGAAGATRGRLEIPTPHLWSPADPHLYRLVVDIGDDSVTVSAGLRSIRCDGPRILLNGKQLYIRGVLDQGYWPETGITAPDDEALLRDLQLARDAGYNLVRKHLKLEEPRFYHHADRLGMLIWAEPASTSRYSDEGASNFEAQIQDMVQRDGNHPSIVIWGLYNEEWGLDWDVTGSPERTEALRRAYDGLAHLDRSRPIVDNSGWSHVRTDLLDWHYYAEHPADWAHVVQGIAEGSRTGFPVKLGPNLLVERLLTSDGQPGDQRLPNLSSEYGGGFTNLERAWHLRWQTQELRRHDAFAGYVYTELTDIEHESAGLFDAERRPKDTGGLVLAATNADTVLIPELQPAQAGTDIATPTAPWELSVRMSHHGATGTAGIVHAGWTTDTSPEPQVEPVASGPIRAEPFQTSAPAVLQISASPSKRGRLVLWYVNDHGATVARTFVDVGPIESDRAMSSLPESMIERIRAD